MEKEHIERGQSMRLEHEVDPDAWKEWLTETPLEQIREQVEEVCEYNGAFDGFEYQIAKVHADNQCSHVEWNIIPLYMLDGTNKAGQIYIEGSLDKIINIFIAKEFEAISKFRKKG